MNNITQKAGKSPDYSSMGVEYISQYSQHWDKDRKNKDLMQVRETIKKNSKLSLDRHQLFIFLYLDRLEITAMTRQGEILLIIRSVRL